MSSFIQATGSLYARYQADNYDTTTNVWRDSYSSTRDIPSASITTTGLSKETVSNNGHQFNVIHGTPSTQIQFLCNSGLTSYTLFNVARYTGLGAKGRILSTDRSCDATANFLSGFWGQNSGMAFHNDWLTNNNADIHGTDWVVSSDSYQIYRSNGVSRVVSAIGSSDLPSLSINRFENAINEKSDFMIADVIIFNKQLSLSQITTIENYLMAIYQSTICPDGSYSSNNICTPCGAGYYCSGGIRSPCPTGSWSSASSISSSSQCIQCEAGKTTAGNSY